MTTLISSDLLETLNEAELYSKFYRAANEVVRTQAAADAASAAVASLENIERALSRKLASRYAPKLG
jgi:hypothetical protein